MKSSSILIYFMLVMKNRQLSTNEDSDYGRRNSFQHIRFGYEYGDYPIITTFFFSIQFESENNNN
jgi:hypothetical protein